MSAKRGLDFMHGLVEDMCAIDPLARPQIDNVVERFEILCKALPASSLKARLRSKKEGVLKSVSLDVAHWSKQLR